MQQPVYYISKTLVDTEARYLPLEKLVLALVHATKKLPHYFQAHTVFVMTEYHLQSLLKRSDFTSKIAKWGTRLGSFDIQYRLRSAIKGQVLADFVAEFSPKNVGGGGWFAMWRIIHGKCLWMVHRVPWGLVLGLS